MNWYTADLHLYDQSMLTFEHQNDPSVPEFGSVEKRFSFIKDGWNKRVKQDDDVYIVGDVSLAGRKETIAALSELNGRKHIILGNHDGGWMHSLARSKTGNVIDVSSGIKRIRDNGKDVVLCHYPIIAWEKQHKGSYLVYGHLHHTHEDTLFMDGGRAFAKACGMTEFRALNCGIMVCGYVPMSLAELCMRNNVGGMWSDSMTPDSNEIG